VYRCRRRHRGHRAAARPGGDPRSARASPPTRPFAGRRGWGNWPHASRTVR
jgi:hypothetical protein